MRYGEGLFIGYRAYDRAHQQVAYPFGFGLSYTTFTLSEPAVRVSGAVGDDLRVDVAVTVTNTGSVGGAEVVQVYVGDDAATVARPDRELKGFARVALDPGESRRVTIALDERAFAFWSVVHDRWAVEAGSFSVHVGTSSRDLPHHLQIDLAAPSLAAPLSARSTLAEWLADPRGNTLLHGLGTMSAALGSEELIAVIGSMPMSTLAGFPGIGIDHATLSSLVERL